MIPIEPLKLSKLHRYLNETDEFLNGTPSNYIILKFLPNIGATHGELVIYNWRNSIIIEQNTPVLEGKRDALLEDGVTKMYQNILVVYKGVRIVDVAKYLQSGIFPKKIMCTPEAFISKVKPAIENDPNLSLYDDFFLLLDECDRLTKDVDFRDKIILPIDDFFLFRNK